MCKHVIQLIQTQATPRGSQILSKHLYYGLNDKMKLECYVEMCDRVFLCKRKSQSSILSLVKHQQATKREIYLLWQTRQHKQGTRYRIIKNINKLYLAHIEQGKSTISFNEPPHNLLIQGDHILLKKLVRLIDHVFKGNDISDKDWLEEPSSFTLKPKTVVVKKKSDYPTLQGFPKTTERLYLSGLGRKSFDRQILRLQSLRILNLENNEISHLPKELGTLPHLEQLFLSGNCLGNSKSIANKWAWMEQDAVSNSLKELDMSNNKIVVLPVQIRRLHALRHLNISQNLLQRVPEVVATLNHLKTLDLSKNQLLLLSGILKNMRLNRLDISSNAFTSSDSKLGPLVNLFYENYKILSLVNLAAKAVMEHRKPYDASVIPYTLVTYLDNAHYCYTCRKSCFPGSYSRTYFYLDLSVYLDSYIAEVKRDRIPDHIIHECYTCSECVKKVLSR